ncbi:MAG TPA: phage baseplate protein, partial [Thermoanaerobaculia bacterium]|nr:phage baseplate protein [Thermoanaerobaculia bacterium]
RRDRLLLELRERTLGPQLVSVAACPSCGERLEVELAVQDLLVDEREEDAPLSVAAGGWEARFRLPHSLDLLALAGSAEPADARRRLLAACLLEARSPEGEDAPVEVLPKEVLQAVADGMAEADPQADLELALTCPACSHAWLALFDIVSFFWTELDAWARVLLHEVHVLASAYNWREADILALSPWRRRTYLEMVGR